MLVEVCLFPFFAGIALLCGIASVILPGAGAAALAAYALITCTAVLRTTTDGRVTFEDWCGY